MASRKALAGALAAAGGVAAGGVALAPLAAGPVGPKDCGSVLPDLPGAAAVAASVPEPRFVQRCGSANDASCLSRTPVAGIVAVKSEADVAKALAYAQARNLTVAAAGVRHSMGGQALPKGGLLLDMRGFDRIELHADRGTVQAGATWHAIQRAIYPRRHRGDARADLRSDRPDRQGGRAVLPALPAPFF